MINLWVNLPPTFRALLGLVLMGIAALIYFFTEGRTLAYGAFCTGFVFLLLSNMGNDKSGYNF